MLSLFFSSESIAKRISCQAKNHIFAKEFCILIFVLWGLIQLIDMNIIETYNPPLSGGRISSPKIRGADQFSDEFEGLAEDAKRFELLKLVKRVGAYAGFTSKMVQLLEYYLVFTKDCD